MILNRYVKGESPEIFMEIPPYRLPSIVTILKKTWMRVEWFLKEAIPWLFVGVALINVLYAVGFIEWLGYIFAPVVEGWFGLPREAIVALLVGFLRKDLAVGMLLPLGMTPAQLAISATVLTIYFPCVATFVVLIKELGLKDMLKSALIMVTTALVVGGIMRLVLIPII
jgi:Fe2+ transport system protein B